MGGVLNVAGGAVSQTQNQVLQATAATGAAGAKAISSSLASVAAGVAAGTAQGIPAAKTMFETAAISVGTGGTVGISSSGAHQNPGDYTKGMKNPPDHMKGVIKQVNDPQLNVAIELNDAANLMQKQKSGRMFDMIANILKMYNQNAKAQVKDIRG